MVLWFCQDCRLPVLLRHLTVLPDDVQRAIVAHLTQHQEA